MPEAAAYQAFFHESLSPMLIIDPDTGQIVDANAAAAGFYGYTAEELAAMGITDINCLDAAAVAEEMQRARRRHTNCFRFRHRLASGAIRDVDVYSSPIVVGERHLLASVIHDVTTQRQTEEALAQAGATLQSLLATTLDGVWLLSADGRVLDVNERYAVMSSHPRQALLQMTLAELQSQLAAGAARLDVGTVRARGYQRLETRLADKDGGLVDLDVSALYVPASTSVVVFLRDITARKGSERRLAAEHGRLQQIIEALPEGLVLYDRAGTRVGLNAAAKALLGADLLGQMLEPEYRAARRLDGTHYTRDELPVMRSMRTGEAVVGEHMLLRNLTTGVQTPVLLNSAPLRAPDGTTDGGMAVLQDISALVALERQRDRMLATVAHDLRNPLTSIAGMSQLLQLRAQDLPQPMRERFVHSLQSIETAAGRMTAQIGELLDYAQALAGRPIDLKVEPTDVVALLERILVEHQHSTDRHALELRAGAASIVAAVDARRLERAIANLLVNAIKYSPQGGPIVVSVAQAVGPDDQWLSIEVADSGLGIPSTDLPHIFEQYYRASNVPASIPGTGIGLAGVRQLIERHGGSVSIDSTEGVGTTVSVRLPLREAAGGVM